jgi:hypothetical protein
LYVFVLLDRQALRRDFLRIAIPGSTFPNGGVPIARTSALLDGWQHVEVEDNERHPGLHGVAVVSCGDHHGEFQRRYDKEALAAMTNCRGPNDLAPPE